MLCPAGLLLGAVVGLTQNRKGRKENLGNPGGFERAYFRARHRSDPPGVGARRAPEMANYGAAGSFNLRRAPA